MYELHLKSFTSKEKKVITCITIEDLLSEIKNNYNNGFDIGKIKNIDSILETSKKLWGDVLAPKSK